MGSTARVQAATFIPFPGVEIEGSLTARFEKVSQAMPDRPALVSGTTTLTYRELDRYSNHVAHALLSRSKTAAEPVILLCGHGITSIVAILGVLKSGKFYAALDPASPLAFQKETLRDTGAEFIITDGENQEAAAALNDGSKRIVDIDEIDFNLPCDEVRTPTTSDSLAVIFYTSGSTGRPKGVMQNHRNLLFNACHTVNQLKIHPGDRITLLAYCWYSVSMSDITGALLSGATLYPYDTRETLIGEMANWLEREDITIFRPSVSYLRSFLSTAQPGLRKIRCVLTGGEPLYKSDVQQFRKLFNADCLLVVKFGITEAGTIAEMVIDRNTKLDKDNIPIGYAVEGKEIEIRDEEGRAVPMNQSGEMRVRSRFFSPGYWKDPDLSRQKFLPDPDGGDRKIYLSGDMAQRGPDGCLDFVGRSDHMVKLRGFRILITDIENSLYKLDGITDALVAARKNNAGEEYLAAYLVTDSPSTPKVSELRASLSEKLPEHMIPSVFTFLDELPKTSTGKLDRLAVPDPDRSRPDLHTELKAPTNPTETKLMSIWEQVLEIRQIGVKDDFFDLGGQSLSAIRLIAQVNNRWGRELPVTELLKSSTIEKMAMALNGQITSPSGSALVPLKPEGDKPPLFLSHRRE